MFSQLWRQSHKPVSTDHSLWREKKSEAESNRGSAYEPDALPLGQAGSQTTVIIS